MGGWTTDGFGCGRSLPLQAVCAVLPGRAVFASSDSPPSLPDLGKRHTHTATPRATLSNGVSYNLSPPYHLSTLEKVVRNRRDTGPHRRGSAGRVHEMEKAGCEKGRRPVPLAAQRVPLRIAAVRPLSADAEAGHQNVCANADVSVDGAPARSRQLPPAIRQPGCLPSTR